MPRRQPFTALCRRAVAPPHAGRADLHTHSTFSDGLYAPGQLVDLARRAGLSALALTDHDTLAGVAAARACAQGTTLEIVSGVEITCEYRQRELHLLAYFVSPDDAALGAALDRLCAARRARFRAMVERLRTLGVSLQEEEVGAAAPGRRHLAELLVRSGRAATIREAFSRYLIDLGRACPPCERLPVAAALALVRDAGGVASWAHPGYDCTRESLVELRAHGLAAVEADYPTTRPARTRALRALAAELGLAVSGGSDCHGPEPAQRHVGSCTVSADEVEALRSHSSKPDARARAL